MEHDTESNSADNETDDDGKPDEATPVWSLAEDRSSQEHLHSLVFVRQLDDDEEHRIRDADELISRTARDPGFGRCVTLLGVVGERVDDLVSSRPPSANQLPALRAALAGLASALAQLAEYIRTHTPGDCGESPLRPEVEQLVAEAVTSDAWGLLGEATEPERGEFLYHEAGGILWKRHSDGNTIDVWALANHCVLNAQLLQIRFLAASADTIEGAARELRRLQTEVPSGRALLVEHSGLAAEPDALRGNITPKGLAFTDIESVMLAVHEARRFQTEAMEQPNDLAQEFPDEETTKVTAPGAESDPPVDNGGDPPVIDGPLDFDQLLSLGRTLAEPLAKEWSRALNEAMLMPALREQVTAFYAVVGALQRRVSMQEDLLGLMGIDSKLPAWPLPPSVLAGLSVGESADEVAERQLRWAQLAAIMDVVEVAKAIQEPSTTTISIGPDERVERFWDAGAFRLLDVRLEHLRRLLGEHEQCLRHRQGEVSDRDAIGTAFQRLQLASRALASADPEAALMHAWLAAIVMFPDTSPDELAATIGELARGNSNLRPFAEAGQRALELAQRLCDGKPVDLGAVSLLAEMAVGIVGELHLPWPEGPRGDLMDIASEIERHQSRVHQIEDIPEDEPDA